MVSGIAGTTEVPYLTVFIGGEEYALPMARVVEMAAWGGITRLPSMPDFVLGLASVQGRPVPVIDLAARFGAAPRPAGRRSIAVVTAMVRGRPSLLGIAVDNLGRLRRVASDEIEAPPGLDPIVAVEYLTGVFEREGRFALCLDVDRVLGADEYDAIAALAAGSATASAPAAAVAPVPFLCVRVGGERCAFTAERLLEILNLTRIARIPGAASFVLGATNVRGTIAPVLDVGVRYGLPASRRSAEASLVLLQTGEGRRTTTVAVLVEGLDGWIRVPPGDIARTPPFGTRFPLPVVTGMVPVAGGLAPILDVDQVLAGG